MGYLMTAQNNIAEEVAWIVGDEAIYKSDIEEQYQQLQYERTPIDGNPYCVIPEQIAIDKLFLHQAKIEHNRSAQFHCTAKRGRAYQLFHR